MSQIVKQVYLIEVSPPQAEDTKGEIVLMHVGEIRVPASMPKPPFPSMARNIGMPKGKALGFLYVVWADDAEEAEYYALKEMLRVLGPMIRKQFSTEELDRMLNEVLDELGVSDQDDEVKHLRSLWGEKE